MKQKLRDMEDQIIRSSIFPVKGVEKEVIMVENFPKLKRYMSPQSKEALQFLYTVNNNESTPRHTVVKLQNTRD